MNGVPTCALPISVLHLAIGSVSVAALTAARNIGPVLGSINVSPIVIGLAIASGAMFALQVNSNFFWMFKSLLGLSTQGTFKTLTMVTSVASVVSLRSEERRVGKSVDLGGRRII